MTTEATEDTSAQAAAFADRNGNPIPGPALDFATSQSHSGAIRADEEAVCEVSERPGAK